jgi:tRNA nucleotidyltransferase/poly(A) polymerase
MSWRDELLRRFPALKTAPAHTVVVGGAIRDLILGRDPADVDIECDAPESVARAIGKVIELGRGDLKVYRVVRGDRIYDVSAHTDLGRRDFTMNAIALDLQSGELRDPFEGESDARRGLLRMIRAENFQDDPLRILRGVRLALQYDFRIEERTLIAMRRRAAHILTIAAERVTYELNASLSFGKFRTAVRLLNETGLDEPLFGYAIDAATFHADDVTCAGAFALILRDPAHFAERWKWSRELLREVVNLQRLLREPDLLAIYEADARDLPALFRAVGREVPPMPDFSVRSLLDGNEIAEITGADGARLGAIKRALIEAQLKGEVKTREEAVRFCGGQPPPAVPS